MKELDQARRAAAAGERTREGEWREDGREDGRGKRPREEGGTSCPPPTEVLSLGVPSFKSFPMNKEHGENDSEGSWKLES